MEHKRDNREREAASVAVADLGQVEEQVLRLAHDGTRVAQLACRLDQIDRVEKLAATVALVAARTISRARRALAFHVAVGQVADKHHTCEYALVRNKITSIFNRE